VAQLVYDVTVRFCDRYIQKRSRTHDQMVQAARSGVQNIAEGSKASGTSKKTELKLTNVARASLEELRLDYEDFLRHRNLCLWDSKDRRGKSLIARRCPNADCVAAWIKEQYGQTGQIGPTGPDQNRAASLSSKSVRSSPSIKSGSSSASSYSEIAANAALILITVACALLDRQLASLAAAFEREGGFTERLYRVRKSARGAAG
jgi:four helix bundle suffix protein